MIKLSFDFFGIKLDTKEEYWDAAYELYKISENVGLDVHLESDNKEFIEYMKNKGVDIKCQTRQLNLK